MTTKTEINQNDYILIWQAMKKIMWKNIYGTAQGLITIIILNMPDSTSLGLHERIVHQGWES